MKFILILALSAPFLLGANKIPEQASEKVNFCSGNPHSTEYCAYMWHRNEIKTYRKKIRIESEKNFWRGKIPVSPISFQVPKLKASLVWHKKLLSNIKKFQPNPIDVAKFYVHDFAQFNCLYLLWNKESGWSAHAHNRSSGAHGIPQALPGSKMASFGNDWYDNPITQIRWGLNYISGSYGSPCNAWNHSVAVNWY